MKGLSSTGWMSVTEVAEMHKVARQTVTAWIRQRKLPAVRPGRSYRIRVEDAGVNVKDISEGEGR